MVILTYIMCNFVFWLIRRGARTPSRIDSDCAIRSEPVLGREPLPRESRYFMIIKHIMLFTILLVDLAVKCYQLPLKYKKDLQGKDLILKGSD